MPRIGTLKLRTWLLLAKQINDLLKKFSVGFLGLFVRPDIAAVEKKSFRF